MQDRQTGCGLWLVFLIAFALAGLTYACVPQAHASETGVASVYGYESGSRRADGRAFHPNEIGCAHKSRPLGTVVTVLVIATHRSIRCPINDRGPYVRGRILDLSVGAARALGVKGLARVRID